ncbi:MAG TPA: ATP-binding protein [Gammaproteobacteria bacterium]
MKRPGFNLSLKLFLVVFLTSLLAIVVMSTAMRLGFQQGFLNFLSELELRRLGKLESVLVQAYQAEGSWAFLQRDSRNWQIFLARYMQAEQINARVNPYSEPPPSPSLLARLAVLDAERRIVAGEAAAQPEAVLRPLRVGGSVVGYLAVAPVQSVTEAAEVTFLQQQLRVILISAGVTAALAALAAIWLTRLFVRPIRIATRSVQQLAGGRYDLLLPENPRDDIGRLYGDINHLATTLANNERLRREYASDIAHELRTPLAILRGELEAIEDGVRPMNAATMESLRGELAQLSTLVDDLHQLQLADTGALNYRKEPVDIGELLEEEQARFSERYAAANIGVQIFSNASRVVLDADASQLGRLFSNLFQNTLRYTDPGGRLEISLHTNDVIEIDFIDTAPGVAEADLPRLLERMFRAEGSRNRVSGGHGLGLAICQKIVAAHRGSIEARHSPLGGVWIHMRFPRDETVEGAIDTNSEEAS